MRAGRIAAALFLGLLCCVRNAQTQPTDSTPVDVAAADPAAGAGLVVVGPEREMTLTPTALATLPTFQMSRPPGPAARAAGERTFEGPLLWTVLAQAGAVDPDKHQDDVRRMVVLTGSDGYTAILALGEISPEFEGKRVILALRADGQALEPGRLRIVVPGDKRGGRGVYDLVRIAVVPAITTPLRQAGR